MVKGGGKPQNRAKPEIRERKGISGARGQGSGVRSGFFAVGNQEGIQRR